MVGRMGCSIELAPTARSKCRGCGTLIGKSEWRFGERLPNPFGRGVATLWFHVRCAAFKRPGPFLTTLVSLDVDLPDRDHLEKRATQGLELRRLPRIDGVELATGARARCRHCHAMIVKGDWRIPLVFFEEGAFNRRGFIHLKCSRQYFDTTDILDRISAFAPYLEPDDVTQLRSMLESTSFAKAGE